MDIPQGIWDLYNNTTSDMILKNFGVNCKIIYGDTRVSCPNCVFNTITKSSSNIYKIGGPIPFENTVCPYCNGEGYTITENSETFKMRVYFNKKDFIRVEIPVTVTDSSIQTIAFITDMPKLQQAKEIIANTDVGNYSIYRYVLAAEILPFGLGPTKKYCIAFWNRNQ